MLIDVADMEILEVAPEGFPVGTLADLLDLA
jgi:uncharacterized protein (DUF3820 family)